jgi:hypothetical protein
LGGSVTGGDRIDLKEGEGDLSHFLLLRLQLGELFGGDLDGLLLKDVQEPRGLMIPPAEFLADLPPSKKCGVDHQGNGECRRERDFSWRNRADFSARPSTSIKKDAVAANLRQ